MNDAISHNDIESHLRVENVTHREFPHLRVKKSQIYLDLNRAHKKNQIQEQRYRWPSEVLNLWANESLNTYHVFADGRDGALPFLTSPWRYQNRAPYRTG